MNKLTIFTPTYNRSKFLYKLYDSLKKQEYKEFTWLLVDDGSSDNTQQVIEEFVSDNILDIKYVRQNNSGKHIAFNRAIELCDSDYFLCIDSDDYIKDKNSIKKILTDMKSLDEHYIGIIYPWTKKIINEKIIKLADKGINVQDIKNIYNFVFESTIVFKTKVLKNFSFPENNEKFMSEEILYNEMANFGEFKLINEVHVCGEYLEDGLTRNLFQLWVKNYENSILLFKSRYIFLNRYSLKIRIVNRLKCIMNCNAVNFGKKKSISNSPNVFASYLLLLPSYVYYLLKKGE